MHVLGLVDGQGFKATLTVSLPDGLRFYTKPRGAAFAYKAAMAGAGGQEPLLALGPISTTRCCRTAMAYLNVCRFAVGSMTRVVGSAFQRSDGGLLCLVHPRRRRFFPLAISRKRCREIGRMLPPGGTEFCWLLSPIRASIRVF